MRRAIARPVGLEISSRVALATRPTIASRSPDGHPDITNPMPDRDTPAPSTPAGRPATVLLVDVDAALTGLVAEWLAPLGIEVQEERDARPGARYDLLIVDLPFPRQDAARRVARVVQEHPDTPVIAVSAAFFPSVTCRGAMACTMGVVGVLPKPVPRADLLNIVQRLLQR